jgi:hypothetical protein
MVYMMQHEETTSGASGRGALRVAPYVLNPDEAALRDAFRRVGANMGSPERTEEYIQRMRTRAALGGEPGAGRVRDENGCHEGWTGNPAYHACMMASYIRFAKHFELPHPQQEYRDTLKRYADFTLEYLGGKPLDFERLRSSMQSNWTSRWVMMIPLMLHAYTLTDDLNYSRPAVMIFDDLMGMVERNPHGYWSVWLRDSTGRRTCHPETAAIFDTTYNPISCQRGIPAFWSEGLLDLIGRERASQFTAAQARYFVVSGQLLDTMEMDSVTAIRA